MSSQQRHQHYRSYDDYRLVPPLPKEFRDYNDRDRGRVSCHDIVDPATGQKVARHYKLNIMQIHPDFMDRTNSFVVRGFDVFDGEKGKVNIYINGQDHPDNVDRLREETVGHLRRNGFIVNIDHSYVEGKNEHFLVLNIPINTSKLPATVDEDPFVQIIELLTMNIRKPPEAEFTRRDTLPADTEKNAILEDRKKQLRARAVEQSTGKPPREDGRAVS